MKIQTLLMGLCSAAVIIACLVLLNPSARFASQAEAATSGGGIPVTANVSSSAGGTGILNANPLRVTLLCQNLGTTNNVYVTFGQTATATNGFLLVPNGGYVSFPEAGCNSVSGNARGVGCVPTGAVNAIAAASGTNTTVCWED